MVEQNYVKSRSRKAVDGAVFYVKTKFEQASVDVGKNEDQKAKYSLWWMWTRTELKKLRERNNFFLQVGL